MLVCRSHDWGTDGSGRSTHARAAQVNEWLKEAGLITWFDSDRMEGDINFRMSEGIDGSGVFLAFITTNYITKVAGKGTRGADDNAKFEFDYACMRRGVERVVPIVFEPDCRDTSTWEGPVGMKLGTKLYSDLCADGDELRGAVLKLSDDLKALTAPRRPRGRASSPSFLFPALELMRRSGSAGQHS